MASGLQCAAPAKVNLALHVTGRRPDGYHLLESLVVFTRHGDKLTVEESRRDSFHITGPFSAGLPLDGTNLVLRARDLMRQVFGPAAGRPVALTLEKNLPIASGIGGGSSDAAAALGLLARFWKLDADAATLARIGLRIGADVPMCLAGRPLLARGIGEALVPLPALPVLPILLVNPGMPLETPAVFSALLHRNNPALPPLEASNGSLEELVAWLGRARNDLEAPALSLVPEIGRTLAQLQAEGALIARMSGSGATCFGIFESVAGAERAAAAIATCRPGWFVQATETTAPVQEASHA